MRRQFFLVKVGRGKTGIVMSGIFDSQPYEDKDWSGQGRQTFYMDMIPNVMLAPDRAPMITTEQLSKAIPSFGMQASVPKHKATVLSFDSCENQNTDSWLIL